MNKAKVREREISSMALRGPRERRRLKRIRNREERGIEFFVKPVSSGLSK